MMSGRVTLIMAVLVLAGMASPIPAAQAQEGNDAALKRQLEEVRQQLQELQLKVQRMEVELNAARAPSPAAVPAPVVAPTAGNPPPPATAAPVGTGVAPMPSSTAAPVTAVPSTVNQPSPAPLRVEAGTSPSQPAVPEAFQWRETLKDQWHNVKAGMSSEEIRGLLGKPSREFTLDGKPVWYYSYPGIGNGSVMFSRDGDTVAGWQHPPFGFW
jgi:hypothetical protein